MVLGVNSNITVGILFDNETGKPCFGVFLCGETGKYNLCRRKIENILHCAERLRIKV